MQSTMNALRRRLREHRRERTELLVLDGRVGCPRSTTGRVDLERCLSCPLLSDIRTDDAGRSWVVCKPATHLVTPEELRAI